MTSSSDWITSSLGKIAEIYQPETIPASKFADVGYEVYGANGIVGLYERYNHATWQTLVTCRGSTCGTVNKTSNHVWITGNAMVLNVDKNHEIDKLFFYYLIANQDFSKCITGTGQPQIVREPLRAIEVRFPKELGEQKAIAEALSDIDELILSAKRELGKKRNLYDGVYYDLFKNAGQWQKKTISELGSLRTSTRKQSNNNPESNFVILDMGSIDERGRVIESKFTNTNDDLLPTGTIVIPKDDIGGGKIIGKGFCVPSDNRYVLGDHVFAFSIFKDNPFFVRYALNFTTSNQEILRIVAGSAQLGLPKSSFLKHSLPVPDIAEQDEIASVLFDMENELSKLIEVIEKYEWLKHGMMNDLLTGKVRLV